MMEWAIGSVAAVATQAAAQAPAAGGTFAALLRSGVSSVNTDVVAAETALRDLAAGKEIELHDVMIALERAQLSVQTFIQVRNKLVEAYQDLTRMQL